MPRPTRPTALAALLAIGLLAGCASPPPPPGGDPEPASTGSEPGPERVCPRVGLYESDAELLDDLPRLFRQHEAVLIVLGRAVYLNRCAHLASVDGAGEESRLAGAGEESRLGGAGEDSRLGGAGEDSRLGGAGEESDLGGAGEDSRLGGAGEESDLGGAGEESRLGGAGEESDLGGAGEDSRLAGAGEDSRLGGAGEESRLGGAGEESRLGGGGSELTCREIDDAIGYRIETPTNRPVRVYDGVMLWRIENGELVPADG